MKRKVSFAQEEYYHIFNRGTDKRIIFADRQDSDRFLQSITEFNAEQPIGSIYQNAYRKKHALSSGVTKRERLVRVVCYCLNQNHYHLILEQLNDAGIERFMQKLGTGFTRYFNEKYKRSGVLFQGPFKAVHIKSNEQLLHTNVYVNLNNRVHQLLNDEVVRSSFDEYVHDGYQSTYFTCDKEIILGQFNSRDDYKKFAEETLEGILERRKNENELGLE